MRKIMEWLWDNKGYTLTGVLILCAFFAGRQTKTDFSLEKEQLKRLTVQGDSLRKAYQVVENHAKLEALTRRSLEKIYKAKIQNADSLRQADQLTIKKYAGIIGIKHTPHELELEMAYIYTHHSVEPQR